jgi:hypothetical protein
MKHSIEFKETTNRYIYNRLYKFRLEKHGKIRCSYCVYHGGDNYDKKWYGTTWKTDKIRHPSWKLATKNRKQWMRGKQFKEYKTSSGHYCAEFIF